MIVTIDGPAGSGKSTAARMLANNLHIAYLDTGATYRAVTLQALRDGVDLADPQAITQIAKQIHLEMTPASHGLGVLIDGLDVTEDIRSAQVTANARYVADCPSARAVLVELQRRIGGRLGDFVAEGRDQGTVVFPEADVKFYLVADSQVRASRRLDEMRARGEQAELQEVLQAIVERDRQDRSRKVGPLTKPQGAIEVDTTAKSIEQVGAELLAHVEAAP